MGGLADSGLMVRMARSRAWIVVLATLLGGIVALNVFGLSLSSSVSRTAAEADRVELESSLLRERIGRANARRGARAAERAALAATSAPIAPEAAVAPGAVAPEPAAAEEPVVEPAPAPAAVESDPTATQARAGQGAEGGTVGGVGPP